MSSSHQDATIPTSTTTTQIHQTLGSFLEVLIHELLYLRSLYPRDAFGITRHSGISCHACRHPQVVEYIYQALRVAVPAVLVGVADQIVLVFYEDAPMGGENVLERYCIACAVDLKELLPSPPGGNQEEEEEIRRRSLQLEVALRNVLLKLISLDGTTLGRTRGQKTFSGNTTFKICLHTSDANPEEHQHGQGRPSCPELDSAMAEGTWFQSDPFVCDIPRPIRNSAISMEWSGGSSGTSTAGDAPKKCLTRPLKSVSIPGLELQIHMESLQKNPQSVS